MSETALRYIAMLQHVPRHPHGITCSELRIKLHQLEYEIDRRTVERDLNHLARKFPITSSDSRPARWFWMRHAQPTMLPGLDPSSAFLFELIACYLTPTMPNAVLAVLDPFFRSTRRSADHPGFPGFSSLSDRVLFLPDTQPLLMPSVSNDVLTTMHQALLNDRRIELSYRPLDLADSQRFIINPLGLLLRGGLHYLVGVISEHTQPRMFSLHRMSDVVVLNEPSEKVPGFDLRQYAQDERLYALPQSGNLQIELCISAQLARDLDERRLSSDQTLSNLPDNPDHYLLSATIADTEHLRWWLRSYGSEVEVVKPLSLRREMGAEYTELARMYRPRGWRMGQIL